ncbi:MAG: universal stress protein [Candidatus Aminicenantales bacterium]
MKGFIKNILWPTDFSGEAKEALLHADLFAKAFSARTTALHVVPDLSPSFYSDNPVVELELSHRMTEMKKEAQARLLALGKRRKPAFKKVIVTEGSPAKKIIETAEREKADLIVMGKKGQSRLEKILIGSAANHVLRHSPVPVLVTKKRKPPRRIKTILVPTDFVKEEEAERESAWKLARGFGASLTFLYVLELFGHEFRMVDQMFQSALDKFQRRAHRGSQGISVSKDVIHESHAAAGIDRYSREHRFDLIVMATCARGLGRFFLGSTTEKVISQTELPVFVLPPKYCT